MDKVEAPGLPVHVATPAGAGPCEGGWCIVALCFMRAGGTVQGLATKLSVLEGLPRQGCLAYIHTVAAWHVNGSPLQVWLGPRMRVMAAVKTILLAGAESLLGLTMTACCT